MLTVEADNQSLLFKLMGMQSFGGGRLGHQL